ERDAIDATDEAALAERAGHQVRIVEGEATNIKITTAEDLPIAEAIAESLRIADFIRSSTGSERPELVEGRNSKSAMPRTGRAGTGYDLHRLIEGRPLVVGGVTIASDRGPLAQSVGRAIGIDAARVSIKAKTNEGVDAIGRGEAIAAHAIALIRAR